MTGPRPSTVADALVPAASIVADAKMHPADAALLVYVAVRGFQADDGYDVGQFRAGDTASLLRLANELSEELDGRARRLQVIADQAAKGGRDPLREAADRAAVHAEDNLDDGPVAEHSVRVLDRDRDLGALVDVPGEEMASAATCALAAFADELELTDREVARQFRAVALALVHELFALLDFVDERAQGGDDDAA